MNYQELVDTILQNLNNEQQAMDLAYDDSIFDTFPNEVVKEKKINDDYYSQITIYQ